MVGYFVSDLHGHIDKYHKLFRIIKTEKPEAVFLGGDLLPSGVMMLTSDDASSVNFIDNFLGVELQKLKNLLKDYYPRIFAILGNDDARIEEASLVELEKMGLLNYVSQRKSAWSQFTVYGYPYVAPTPFLLKDWEKYDISRFVDPGCISPEEGIRTVDIPEHDKKFSTIANDLESLPEDIKPENSIFLFHSPPHDTRLDRAALDGKMIDYVPLDPHIGSIAIKRFIDKYQPLITLHGHVHESTGITGSWKEQFGKTWAFNAAHNGAELSVIIFDPRNPAGASRILI